MDMASYAKKKDQKTVSLQRLGKNVYQLVAVRYDADTAEELDPEVQQFTVADIDRISAELDKELATLQLRKDNLAIIKQDMLALPKP